MKVISKSLLTITILFSIAISCFAYNKLSPKDSLLLDELKTSIRENIISKNYDSAMVLCNKGIIKAVSLDNQKFLAKCYSYKAVIHKRLDNMDSALRYNLQCKKIRTELNDEKGLSVIYLNLGTIYQETGNYDQAKNHYLQALELKIKLEETKHEIDIYNNLGNIFRLEGKYKKSNGYFEKAISKSKLLQDTFRIANSLNNLGINYSRIENFEASDFYYEEAMELYNAVGKTENAISCYINLARNLSLRNDNDKAFKKYQIAKELAKEEGSTKQLASIYTNMASMLIKFESYQKALDYSMQALELNKKINRKTGITSSNINIARSYIHLKNYKLAEKHLKEALEIIKVTNDRINKRYVFKYFAELYYKMGQYKKAYDYREKNEVLEDSVLNVEVASQIENFRVKYESKEKESKIRELSKEKEIKDLKIQQRTYLAVISAFATLLIIVLALLLLRQNKLKSKKEESALKQKLLRTQMNPHFIFNALGAIQNYIFSNKTLEAGKYLSKFSNLMRNILESSANELIPIEQEIETIETYLLLQKLRQKGVFNYELTNEINEDVNIPPMLAQPFIENSIKHAFLGFETAGRITIRYFDSKDFIHIEVSDNGIGIKKTDNTNQSAHKSMAIDLTTERLKLISKKSIKSSIKIMNLEELGKKGTCIEIKIPKEVCLKY